MTTCPSPGVRCSCRPRCFHGQLCVLLSVLHVKQAGSQPSSAQICLPWSPHAGRIQSGCRTHAARWPSLLSHAPLTGPIPGYSEHRHPLPSLHLGLGSLPHSCFHHLHTGQKTSPKGTVPATLLLPTSSFLAVLVTPPVLSSCTACLHSPTRDQAQGRGAALGIVLTQSRSRSQRMEHERQKLSDVIVLVFLTAHFAFTVFLAQEPATPH